MERFPKEIEDIILSFDGEQSYVTITYDNLLYLQLHDRMRYFNAALCNKAQQFVYVLVEFEGVVQYIHITDIANFSSIRENGLKQEYAYPSEGQSSVAGVYALRYDCPYGMLGLKTVLGDMYPDTGGAPPLVCAGTYTGKYYLVVNSLEYNYIILTQDTPVDRFYTLLGSRFLPVQSFEDIASLLLKRSGAPVW